MKDMSEETSQAQISNRAQSLEPNPRGKGSLKHSRAPYWLSLSWKGLGKHHLLWTGGKRYSPAGFSQHCMETHVGQAQLDTAWTMIQERELLLLLKEYYMIKQHHVSSQALWVSASWLEKNHVNAGSSVSLEHILKNTSSIEWFSPIK